MTAEGEERVQLTPEDIQEILRIFADSSLEELHIEAGGTSLYVSKSAGGSGLAASRPFSSAAASGSVAHSVAPSLEAGTSRGTAQTGSATPADAAATAAATDEDGGAPPAPEPGRAVDGTVDVTSPLLGVFYRRPAPGEPSFVELGSEVEADSPVCIVDVMKMFTRVEAGHAGRVVEICAEDGQLVEHGQVLMRIVPA